MNTDNYTLSALGKLAKPDDQRDAVHMAVIPAEAGELLAPGQRVAIQDGKAVLRVVGQVGVVDPFLDLAVRKGERFWLFMAPGTVTALRHAWYHSAFPSEDAVPGRVQSEMWLRQFLSEHNNARYEDVVRAAHEGSFFVQYGSTSLRDLGDDSEAMREVLRHLAVVLGGTPVEGFGFDCSC